MNAHIPQSYEATAELAEIAAVPMQIIRPRDSTPVIGVTQDALAGSYLATLRGNEFTRREFMNMMMKNKRFSEVPQPRESGRYTGQQIIGTLFAPINMTMPNKLYKKEGEDDFIPPNNEDNMVQIREGEFMNGVLDKAIFNSAGKGILHTTYNDYGPNAAVDLLDGLQSMMETYLIMKGFSVGISDLIANESTKEEMDAVIVAKKKELEDLVMSLHTDLFTNNSGKSNQEEFEARANGIMNKALGEAGKKGVASLPNQNRLMTMVRSGSKGDEVNVAQMISCLGQVNVEGKRIPYGFTDRTLPHFKMYDDGAEARGFVQSSFMKGLTPTEFFFHAMSGREGLIDTAVKSVTGDTPIFIIVNGVPQRVRIGDWIDQHLAKNPEGIKHYDEANMELLELDSEVYIPTCDSKGKMSWGKLTAVTRHDPGDALYEVKTLSGKEVIITKAKSLIVWNKETQEFEDKFTEQVNVGDFLPVTMNLVDSPMIQSTVSLDNYLSKKEYVYGTEFHTAKRLMEEAMQGRDKIPVGWWEQHNGTSFTLPYSSKAHLQRAIVRSNPVHKGYVYPFHAIRTEAQIPETIALTQEFGRFIGLFLAEGNVDVKSGYVQITNQNENILDFVKEFFESMKIVYSQDIHVNAICGVSACVRGYSTLLAKFLDRFTGHGAAHKFVPPVMMISPLDCVKGVLDGYFSGDGTVSKTSVEVGSASKELIDGIAMLCTRLGMFGKMFKSQLIKNNLGTQTIQPTYRFSLRAQWAAKFASQITLIDDVKQKRLQQLAPSVSHRNFSSTEDVVLDEIISIEPVNVEKYPKMYDVTVPSTFNFGIASGLILRDTAETGYTQRQLIKAMENLMTQHDGTVRDGMGKIVQFRYGEDGLASTKLESINLPLIKLSNEKIERDFGLQGVDFTTILDASVTREADDELVKDYVKQVIQDRDMIVKNVYGFTDGTNYKLTAPLNLERIILNMKIKFNLQKDGRSDLTPMTVIEDVMRLIERTQPYNKIWAANVRFHLAPHKIIVQHRFTKLAWDTMMETILVKDWKAWALPGELVGIVAAQSIGEPTTQMSAIKSTKIVVNSGKHMSYKGAIGPFIDTLLEKYKSDVVTIGEDSVVLDLSEDVHILGVSTDEKTSWRRISQVSRHPANGGLVEVHTRSGRKTTATLSHSFLRRSTKGIVPVLGSDLKVGMRIPVAKVIPEVADPIRVMTKGDTSLALDKAFGWLCGMYLADGSLGGRFVRITKMAPIVEERLRSISETYKWEFTTRVYESEFGLCKENVIHSKDLRDFMDEHFSKGSYGKNIGAFVFNAPVEFISGVIGGYFDGDGNVTAERQQIRASSRSKELIEDIAQLLGYCGMFGLMGEEKSVHMPGKVMYTVNIPRKYAHDYKVKIGFAIEEKTVELEKVIEYNSREDVHSFMELVDKVPELGDVIAETGRLLDMPGCSRNYGRWAKKESVGRRTLGKYIRAFKEAVDAQGGPLAHKKAMENIGILESAYTAEVFWDEIVELVYLEDPKEYVYDFTVPGNDSFMVDNNILVHNTLNTFHQAGVAAKSAVTRGVPRLKELLKVTKNPKATSITVALKPAFRNDKDMVRLVSQDLELTRLKDIVRKAAIYYDSTDEQSIIEEDRDLIKFFKGMELRDERYDDVKDGLSKWILRFEFDREKMFNKNITMDDVNFVVQDAYGFHASSEGSNLNIIYSDYNSQKLVMRIRPRVGGAIYGDDLASIKKLLNVLLNNTIIRGVAGIRAVTWRKDNTRVELVDGEYKKASQYLLDTDGSNFVAIMTHPAVDGNSMYSTNVHDIYEQLGIEATRNVLYSEMNGLFNPDDINYRHLGLLCDVMTHAGKPMSVDRYGINKMDSGPLAKACFEETEKVLKNAALFGEMDPVTGVSANIMMGQPIRAGTAFTQILLDEDALPKLMEGLPDVEEEEDEEGPTQEQIDEQLYGQSKDACAQLETQMNMILPDPDANLQDEDDIEIIELKA